MQKKYDYKKYRKVAREKRREYALKTLGGECTVCGDTDRLEFDHIDPTTVSFRIQDTRGLSRSWKDLKAELEKCQLLCHNCHVKKTNTDRYGVASSPHGISKYTNERCRCDTCRSAWNEYHRTLRKKVLI